MPNIPKPLHGKGCQPRTIYGDAAWNQLRKKTYYLAGYKSEISGEDGSAPGALHAHELFTIDYEKGTSEFVRPVAITPLEHVYFIHSGRAITLCRQGNPLYTPERLLAGAEHGFKLIHEWNQAHPDEPKLKPYATFLEWMKLPALEKKMAELIERYEIEFWEEDKKKYAPWESWKVIVDGKEYPTPYKDYHAWEEAMEEAGKKDTHRQIKDVFTGGVYDDIKKMLEEGE